MTRERLTGACVERQSTRPVNPINIIFPQDVNFLLNQPPSPVMTIIEGSPGVGKTLLTFLIAAEVARAGRALDQFVLFVAMEQKIESLQRLAEQFVPRDVLDEMFFGEGSCREDDCGLGGLAAVKDSPRSFLVFKPIEADSDARVPLTTRDFIPTLRKIISAAQSILHRECCLVIVDNANVIQTAQEDAGEAPAAPGATCCLSEALRGTRAVVDRHERPRSGPLSRPFLRRLYNDLKTSTQSMLLVVEGHPEKVQPHIDFFADVVIRMSHEGEGAARRAVLQVKKSRNRETSPGVHTVTINSDGLHLWPSPESILRMHAESKARYLSPDAVPTGLTLPACLTGQTGIRGWHEEFDLPDPPKVDDKAPKPQDGAAPPLPPPDTGPKTLLRARDIVVIAGPPNSGKSQLLRALMRVTPPPARNDERDGAEHTVEGAAPVAPPADTFTDTTATPTADEKKHAVCPSCLTEHEETQGPVLIVWHKSVDPGREAFRTVLVPSEPFWDRNRLFYELYRSLLPLADKGVIIGIENLSVMLAAFPFVAHDDTLIPAFFDLLRSLGLTAFIEMTVAPDAIRDSAYAPQRQAQELADVLIQIDESSSSEGRILTLDVSAASTRIKSSRKRVYWNPVLETVTSKEIEAYYETFDHGMRVLKQREITLALPVWTRTEREHATVLQMDASAVAGAANVSLVPIVSAGIVPADERNIDVLRSPAPPREMFNRYALDEVIRRRALHNRASLTLMVCGDDVLDSRDWREPQRELGCPAREHYLEPLGKEQDWRRSLRAEKADDMLVDFLTNSNGDVIGVPYAIDMVVLAWRTEVYHAIQCCLSDKEFTDCEALAMGVSLERLIKTVNAIRHCTARVRDGTLTAKRRLRDGAPDPHITATEVEELTTRFTLALKSVKDPFELVGYGRETCIALATAFLLNNGDLVEKDSPDRKQVSVRNFNTQVNVKAIQDLRGVMKSSGVDINPEQVPLDAAISAGWYSRLSALGAGGFPDLARQGIQIGPAGVKHWLCAIQYFVVPKGAGSPALARNLIESFCRRDYALERARKLVGISPFRHAEYELAFLPRELRDVLLKRDQFQSLCWARNRILSNYGKQAAIAGERIQTALLSRHHEGALTEQEYIRDCLTTLDKVRCSEQ